MGKLNLYKLDSRTIEHFKEKLEEKYEPIGEHRQITRTIYDTETVFDLSFYADIPTGENVVEWNWLLNNFGDGEITTRSNPKGVLLVEVLNEAYLCTFGFSYFFADKYCDTDFAFDFARRIEYKEVKTTTLLSPTLKRNKVVNTYLDYNNLEFDSGESYAKIKVKAKLPETFVLFKPNLEFGNSIRFDIEDSLETIIGVILYVRDKLINETEIYKIPVFKKVTDKEVIDELNHNLDVNLQENPLLINLSELDIVGVTEIFNNNDASFEIKYGHRKFTTSKLDAENILAFMRQQNLSVFEGLEKIKVVSFNSGAPVRTETLFNLIDYVDDDKRCMLSKGKWYFYNDDYLDYLAASVADIDAYYNVTYDFSKEQYEKIIDNKYQEERYNPEYADLEQEEVLRKLKLKYYREYAFNLFMSDNYEFECFDRISTNVDGAKIELMDLYKNETLCAVKFGKASSSLCYAIDQSTETLKLYKHRITDELPSAKNFAVWLILDRRTHLSLNDGKPNLNELNMITLKNKLDAWKKEVRIQGFTPMVMVNYYN